MRSPLLLLICVVPGLLMSCTDAGILIEDPEPPVVDCGSFELYSPEDTVGDYYYITGVRVYPLDRKVENGITHDFYCSTLQGWLAFAVNTEYRRLKYDDLNSYPGVISDPRMGEIVNPVKWESASCRFNKPIVFRGETIPAGTNLLTNIPVDGITFYFPQTISPFSIGLIRMVKDFVVPNGDYMLSVRWETMDGRVIADTVDVAIRLQ